MAVDARAVDQIVVVGRASTRERTVTAIQWAWEVRGSLLFDPEDLTVQVKLAPKGCWHRKAIGGLETACGHRLGGYGSRDESYRGELCTDGCFSPHELHALARLVEDPTEATPADEE
jgi:hypothetical protein